MNFRRISISLAVMVVTVIVVASGATFVSADTGIYKGPSAMAVTPDNQTVCVTCLDSGELMLLSVADSRVVKTIPVVAETSGVCLSPDGTTAFVTGGGVHGKVQQINLATGKIEKEAATGHTPIGPAITPDGKKLYVCNRFNATVTEFSLPDLTVIRQIKAVREPCAAAVTPNGKTVFVLNHIPYDPADSFDVAATVTCIDTVTGEATQVRLPNGSGSLCDLVISPDGKYVFITEILARYQMPTNQIERGWINTNAVSILNAETKEFINAVLLDDVDLGASNPWGITLSKDGKQMYVAVSGTHEIIVIDLEGMFTKLLALPKNMAEAKAKGIAVGTGATKVATDVPNDLAFLVGLKRRIKLTNREAFVPGKELPFFGKGPRAIVEIDGQVWTGLFFADMVLKVTPNVPGNPKMEPIPLGPKPEMTAERRGESHWNDATMCFQQWLSCASCHPDARVDGYNWDLLNDGMGNPKNAKSMLYCSKNPPAMWEGVRASSEVAIGTGFKFILFSVRSQQELEDIAAFLRGLKPVPSPYLVDGRLSVVAERGKKIFDDPKVGCAVCHSGAYYADLKMHDVGTKKQGTDRKSEFDTPQLNEIWRTAPYLHDGRYLTLHELFKEGKHGDVLGDVEGLTDSQVDDLVEYVLSL